MEQSTVRHFWQDHNPEDCIDGDIDAPVNSASHDFDDVRDLIEYLMGDFGHDGVFTVGEGIGPVETCDLQAFYYHRRWPVGFGRGDKQYRSGSIHLPEDVSPHVLRAVMARCDVYDANRSWRKP